MSDQDAIRLLELLRDYMRMHGREDEPGTLTVREVAVGLVQSTPRAMLPADTLWLTGERV